MDEQSIVPDKQDVMHRPPPAPVRWTHQLENSSWPDRLATVLQVPADALAASPARERLLQGRPVGHAAHPSMTMMPLGMWAATSVLDLFGHKPSDAAAQRLLGAGLLAVAPTVATGLAEWRTTSGASRRVGAVHAGVNTVASALMTGSYLARRQRRRSVATILALAGNCVATVGGYLGGHLSIVRQVGSKDPAFLHSPN